MTYPTQSELREMIRETGKPESMALSVIALRTGFAWDELNELNNVGRVSEQTAAYWNMVRANG